MGMSRVMITGAAGFSGRHACRRFSAAGWEVIAVDSGRSRAEAAAAWRRESCELTDRDAVLRLVSDAKPDALLHLAGQNAVDRSWREPGRTLAVNAMSTAWLLEALLETNPGGKALVVGSMLREPADSAGHPYSFSKSVQVSAALAWHRWYGLPVLVAEPSNLIGPGGSGGICGLIARWAALAERGGSSQGGKCPPFRLSSLSEERDYLDVRDAADAYELLLRRGAPGRCYPIESGTMRSLGEIRHAYDNAAEGPLAWEVGDAARPSPRPRDCSGIRELGWRPAVPFEDSIRDALEEERRRFASGEGELEK